MAYRITKISATSKDDPREALYKLRERLATLSDELEYALNDIDRRLNEAETNLVSLERSKEDEL